MIRYDSSYNQEISRVVSNFNRKVRRLEKEERQLLPSAVKVSEIKDRFTSRRELNKYLNDLRRFGKRGAEEIVTIDGKQYTKYQIDLFRTNLRRQRAQLAKDIESAENMDHRYPMQHNITLQNLKNRKEKLSMAWTDIIGGEWDKVINQRFVNMETYDNYLEILFQDAYQSGFDPEKAEYIKNKLLELSPNKFIRALEDAPEIKFIFDYYHALTRQAGIAGRRADRDAYEQLYKRIDQIVENYK